MQEKTYYHITTTIQSIIVFIQGTYMHYQEKEESSIFGDKRKAAELAQMSLVHPKNIELPR